MKSLLIYTDGALKWIDTVWGPLYEEIIYVGYPPSPPYIEEDSICTTRVRTRYFINISKEKELAVYLEKD